MIRRGIIFIDDTDCYCFNDIVSRIAPESSDTDLDFIEIKFDDLHESYDYEELNEKIDEEYDVIYSSEYVNWRGFCSDFGINPSCKGIYFTVVDVEIHKFDML